jgi:hypothetical protein
MFSNLQSGSIQSLELRIEGLNPAAVGTRQKYWKREKMLFSRGIHIKRTIIVENKFFFLFPKFYPNFGSNSILSLELRIEGSKIATAVTGIKFSKNTKKVLVSF